MFVRLLTERSGLHVAALMGETEVHAGVFISTDSLALSPQTWRDFGSYTRSSSKVSVYLI